MNKTFFQSFLPEGIFVVPEREMVVTDLTSSIAVPDEVQILKKTVSYIGENKKKILVIVHERNGMISETDKEFLGKVLGAIRLTYNDIALVNSYLYPDIQFSHLENIAFTKLILFGSELISLFDTKLLKYKLTEKENVEVLFSDSLAEIQEDKSKKIKLWEELKKMFP